MASETKSSTSSNSPIGALIGSLIMRENPSRVARRSDLEGRARVISSNTHVPCGRLAGPGVQNSPAGLTIPRDSINAPCHN